MIWFVSFCRVSKTQSWHWSYTQKGQCLDPFSGYFTFDSCMIMFIYNELYMYIYSNIHISHIDLFIYLLCIDLCVSFLEQVVLQMMFLMFPVLAWLPMIIPHNWSFNMFHQRVIRATLFVSLHGLNQERRLHFRGLWRFCEKGPEKNGWREWLPLPSTSLLCFWKWRPQEWQTSEPPRPQTARAVQRISCFDGTLRSWERAAHRSA